MEWSQATLKSSTSFAGVRAFFVYGNARGESRLTASRNPWLRAISAVLLLTLILRYNGNGSRLSVSGFRLSALLRQDSGDSPFLPLSSRQKTLTAQAYPKTNFAAAKDSWIPALGSSSTVIEELTALLATRQGGFVHLLMLLGNSFPDRAPPHLT